MDDQRTNAGGRRDSDPQLEKISEQLGELTALFKKHVDLEERRDALLRDEIHANRKLGRDLAGSVVDLRIELEHQRSVSKHIDRLFDVSDQLKASASGGG